MITIKELKKGDIIQINNRFRKVISIINEDLVALSADWYKHNSKENIEQWSQSFNNLYTQYDLKDYILVKQEWSWKDLKVGDEYCHINSMGDIYNTIWSNYEIDLFRAKSGNIYQTEKEAEEAYKLIMSKE